MKKILVVDDSEVSLFLIQEAFSDNKNIQLIIEKDGIKTLKKLKEHKSDVLILDLKMPEIDGFQIIQQIKADTELSKVKIIVISALINNSVKRKLRILGIKYIFEKPLELNEITLAIEELFK